MKTNPPVPATFHVGDKVRVKPGIKDDQEVWEMPLGLLEASTNDPNSQLLQDYVHWFAQWGEPAPGHRPLIGQENDDQLNSSEFGKTGRNDPCPCGSGKKFKKCCLRKLTGETIFPD
jgi:hypothetical protein